MCLAGSRFHKWEGHFTSGFLSPLQIWLNSNLQPSRSSILNTIATLLTLDYLVQQWIWTSQCCHSSSLMRKVATHVTFQIWTQQINLLEADQSNGSCPCNWHDSASCSCNKDKEAWNNWCIQNMITYCLHSSLGISHIYLTANST